MRKIFVSSTFKDMQEERNLLNNIVLPKIKNYAKKYNEEIYFTDLRWGVNTDNLDSDEGAKKVLEVCFKEIEKSRPFMIIFIGERYGWIPDNKILEDTVSKYDIDDYLDKSVTELEIIYGALKEKNLDNCIFCFRNELDLNNNKKLEKIYKAESDKHKDKLNKLKKKILDLKPKHVIYYDAKIKDDNLVIEDKLKNSIEDTLKEEIDNECKDKLNVKWQDLELERMDNYTLIESNKYREDDNFTNLLNDINSSILPYYIIGKSGCGKTNLMSKIYNYYKDSNEYIPFIFLTETSIHTNNFSDYYSLLNTFISKLVKENKYYDYGERSLDGCKSDFLNLYDMFVSKYKDKKLLILIDAFDSVSLRPNCSKYDELLELDNLKYIVSDTEKTLADLKYKSTDVTYYQSDNVEYILDNILDSNNKELADVVKKKIIDLPNSCIPFYLQLVLDRLFKMSKEDYDKIKEYGDNMEAINRVQLEIIDEIPIDLKDLVSYYINYADRVVGDNDFSMVLELISLYNGILNRNVIRDILKLENVDFNDLEFSRLLYYLDLLLYEDNDNGNIYTTHSNITFNTLSTNNKGKLYKLIYKYSKDLENDNRFKINMYSNTLFGLYKIEEYYDYLNDLYKDNDRKTFSVVAMKLIINISGFLNMFKDTDEFKYVQDMISPLKNDKYYDMVSDWFIDELFSTLTSIEVNTKHRLSMTIGTSLVSMFSLIISDIFEYLKENSSLDKDKKISNMEKVYTILHKSILNKINLVSNDYPELCLKDCDTAITFLNSNLFLSDKDKVIGLLKIYLEEVHIYRYLGDYKKYVELLFKLRNVADTLNDDDKVIKLKISILDELSSIVDEVDNYNIELSYIRKVKDNNSNFDEKYARELDMMEFMVIDKLLLKYLEDNNDKEYDKLLKELDNNKFDEIVRECILLRGDFHKLRVYVEKKDKDKALKLYNELKYRYKRCSLINPFLVKNLDNYLDDLDYLMKDYLDKDSLNRIKLKIEFNEAINKEGDKINNCFELFKKYYEFSEIEKNEDNLRFVYKLFFDNGLSLYCIPFINEIILMDKLNYNINYYAFDLINCLFDAASEYEEENNLEKALYYYELINNIYCDCKEASLIYYRTNIDLIPYYAMRGEKEKLRKLKNKMFYYNSLICRDFPDNFNDLKNDYIDALYKYEAIPMSITFRRPFLEENYKKILEYYNKYEKEISDGSGDIKIYNDLLDLVNKYDKDDELIEFRLLANIWLLNNYINKDLEDDVLRIADVIFKINNKLDMTNYAYVTNLNNFYDMLYKFFNKSNIDDKNRLCYETRLQQFKMNFKYINDVSDSIYAVKEILLQIQNNILPLLIENKDIEDRKNTFMIVIQATVNNNILYNGNLEYTLDSTYELLNIYNDNYDDVNVMADWIIDVYKNYSNYVNYIEYKIKEKLKSYKDIKR